MIETPLGLLPKSSEFFGNPGTSSEIFGNFQNIGQRLCDLRTIFGESSESFGKWSEIFGKSSKTPSLVCLVYNKEKTLHISSKISILCSRDMNNISRVSCAHL